MKQIATKQDVTTSLAAEGFNSIAEELEGVVESTGQTLDTSGESAVDPNTSQIRKAITAIGQVASSCSVSGSGNLFVLSQRGGVVPAVSYYDGQSLSFFSDRITSGDVTCNYSGLGVKKIFSADGGEIAPGGISTSSVSIVYSESADGGSGAFILELGGFVSIIGNEDVGGVKTFSSSPVIPTPVSTDNSTKAASTAFVQSVSGGYRNFGVGANGPIGIADFNSPSNDDAGFLSQLSAVSGLTNIPNNFSQTRTNLISLGHSSYPVQLAFQGEKFSFRSVDGDFAGSVNWREVLHSGNEEQIGVGQAWQDLTSQRAAGVTYTNNTGKPIEISITSSSNTSIDIEVGGVSFSGVGGQSSAMAIIVPNGVTYRSISTFLEWRELR